MKKIFATAIFALALVSFGGCWGWGPIDPYNGGGGGHHGGGCGDSVVVDPGNGGGVDTLNVDPWPSDSSDVPPDSVVYIHP